MRQKGERIRLDFDVSRNEINGGSCGFEYDRTEQRKVELTKLTIVTKG